MGSDVNHTDKISVRVPLLQLLDRVERRLQSQTLEAVAKMNEKNIQPADLKLLANLDCGTTYASEVARRMGISRQSVNKLLKNLVREGLVTLQQDPERRNTKMIVMTDDGQSWIREAVAVSERLESELAERVGRDHVTALRRALEAVWDLEAPPLIPATRRLRVAHQVASVLEAPPLIPATRRVEARS